MALSAAERERYGRHLVLEEIGPAGQERLRAASIVLIGAGGLGSPAALYLTASGIGRLGIIDADRVELSNLQRQVLFDTASVGRPKAEVARERLLALNPGVQVEAHAVELRAANARALLQPYDVVIDGTDRLATRYLVNDACVLFGKPLVSAAIHRFEGQAITYVPGRGPCYRCLFPRALDAHVGSCAEAGVLGVLPGVLGALQATEAIKLIAGIGTPLAGRILTYDALEMRFECLQFARRRDCAVCGDEPSIRELHDAAAACAPASLEAVRRLSPAQLRELLESASPPALIDVREPAEFARGHVRGAVNVPLGELSARLGALPADRLVFYCRSGARSLSACALAIATGAQIAHLEGGTLAWEQAGEPLVIA